MENNKSSDTVLNLVTGHPIKDAGKSDHDLCYVSSVDITSLVTVSPIHKDFLGGGGNVVLTFCRQHQPTTCIRFNDLELAVAGRTFIMDAWLEVLSIARVKEETVA